MSNKDNKKRDEEDDEYEFPGYPLYPKSQDIYNKGKEEQGIDPEDVSHQKDIRKKNRYKEKNDLDVPGAELDDEEENIGSEDEENNYYSLGGDNHNDLEEDKGE